MATSPTPYLPGIATLAERYSVILCDIWGVLHNGIAAWPSSVEALHALRDAGKTVVLISNSPRPAEAVVKQLASLGVPREAYDLIVTSGDVTRALFEGRYKGSNVCHIGPEKDKPLLDGLPVTFTPDADADVCLCSGLLDDQTETPEDYRERLQGLLELGLPMVCANPDKVVEMGGRLIYCAGALAELYEKLGGEIIILGKPFAPIYEATLERVGNPNVAQYLALGDSMSTDLQGAANQGIDCVFITGGIHAADFGPSTMPNPMRVQAYLSEAPYPAIGWMARLSW